MELKLFQNISNIKGHCFAYQNHLRAVTRDDAPCTLFFQSYVYMNLRTCLRYTQVKVGSNKLA